MSTLADQYEDLRRIIRSLGRVLVAYSGGVDSALVAAVAHRELGSGALACIGVSPSYPTRERRRAVALMKRVGAAWRLVETGEHLDPRYAANPDNRCYFCKADLYERLRSIAVAEGWDVIVDGTHADDMGDQRPGLSAGRQRGVRSPLAEAHLTKPQVRALAKQLGLANWDKPAMACLASRIPHGTPITPELLKQVEAAEDVLVELGFAQFRVRHHGEVARIELPEGDLGRAMEQRGRIVEGVRSAGYRHVALDLAGFRREGPPAPAAEGSRPVQLSITASRSPDRPAGPNPPRPAVV